MTNGEFRKFAHELVDWVADYYENIRNYPVKSQVKPNEIKEQLPSAIPIEGEAFEEIFADFQRIIMPGITHWQHPNFHAYFPSNNSYPSILGEFLSAALGVQGMSWETSPAATELEEVVMNWLKQAIALPDEFEGVIQDTASTSTLCSILTAREKYSSFHINRSGLEQSNLRVYCSVEAHSSIERAVKIAGIGSENLVKIPVDKDFAMLPDELEKAINQDMNNNYEPMAVVAAIGTTGSAAIDPLDKISEVCRRNGMWLHVDAALAGSALILPEMQHYLKGIENADSLVFNPHKWLFTNFDCSAYFVKDKSALIRTFEILPEYLKTQSDSQVHNYRDWGIQLGRRFRSLKLWFVLRTYGLQGLQEKIREHMQITQSIAEIIAERSDFELMAPVNFNVICFRYKPAAGLARSLLNYLNKALLQKVNQSGKAYLTHTKLKGNYVIRFVIGQTNVSKLDAMRSWRIIEDAALEISQGPIDLLRQ